MSPEVARGGSRRAIRALLATLLIGTVLGTLFLGAAEPALAASTGARQQMFSLTNKSRADHGVRRLKLNSRLSNIATRHSRKMAAKGRLFHTANVPHKLRRWRWTTWGENVGMTSGTLAVLQDAFMHSPVHRANILNRKFRHVGVGVAHVGDAFWVTLVFYG
jgi:uncharacterized protein YkwD